MLGGKAQDSTMRWTTEVSTDNECMYNWFGLKAWKHFCISIYKKDRMESFKFTKPINVSHRDITHNFGQVLWKSTIGSKLLWDMKASLL